MASSTKAARNGSFEASSIQVPIEERYEARALPPIEQRLEHFERIRPQRWVLSEYVRAHASYDFPWINELTQAQDADEPFA
jgi:hypothetical protein